MSDVRIATEWGPAPWDPSQWDLVTVIRGEAMRVRHADGREEEVSAFRVALGPEGQVFLLRAEHVPTATAPVAVASASVGARGKGAVDFPATSRAPAFGPPGVVDPYGRWAPPPTVAEQLDRRRR